MMLREMAEKYGYLESPRGGFSFPLTPQQNYYIDRSLAGNGIPQITSGTHIRGPLDVNRLERAIARLINQSDCLRVRFKRVDGEIVQQVVSCVDFQLDVRVASGSTGEERLIDAQRQAIIGFKGEINPFSEDQFAFCLYQIDRSEFLFTFSMGHALLDGISMFLLLDRIFRYYNADDSGPYVEEPSFVRYAQWLADFQNSPAGKQQMDFWDRRHAEIRDLPFAAPGPIADEQSVGPCEITFQREVLEAFARKARTSTANLLVTALHLALDKVFGVTDSAFTLASANRSHSEFSQVAGLLVRGVPHQLKVSEGQTCGELLSLCMRHTSELVANQDLCSMNLTKSAFTSHNFTQQMTLIPGLEMTPWIPEFHQEYGLLLFEHWNLLDEVRVTFRGDLKIFNTGQVRKIAEETREAIQFLMEHLEEPVSGYLAAESEEMRLNIPERVLSVWLQELQLERIESDDSFFDLGGNSLIASRVADQLSRDLGIEVAIADLFEFDTLEVFTKMIIDKVPTDS